MTSKLIDIDTIDEYPVTPYTIFQFVNCDADSLQKLLSLFNESITCYNYEEILKHIGNKMYRIGEIVEIINK